VKDASLYRAKVWYAVGGKEWPEPYYGPPQEHRFVESDIVALGCFGVLWIGDRVRRVTRAIIEPYCGGY